MLIAYSAAMVALFLLLGFLPWYSSTVGPPRSSLYLFSPLNEIFLKSDNFFFLGSYFLEFPGVREIGISIIFLVLALASGFVSIFRARLSLVSGALAVGAGVLALAALGILNTSGGLVLIPGSWLEGSRPRVTWVPYASVLAGGGLIVSGFLRIRLQSILPPMQPISKWRISRPKSWINIIGGVITLVSLFLPWSALYLGSPVDVNLLGPFRPFRAWELGFTFIRFGGDLFILSSVIVGVGALISIIHPGGALITIVGLLLFLQIRIEYPLFQQLNLAYGFGLVWIGALVSLGGFIHLAPSRKSDVDKIWLFCPYCGHRNERDETRCMRCRKNMISGQLEDR